MKNYEGTSGSTNYTLKAGWNVISFTHLPDNKSVSSILSTLTFGTDYDQVSTWDSASSSWKHWVNDSDFNDFTNFEYGKTYEIYNKSGSDKSFSVTGRTRGTDITHNIVTGDNFISPAVKTATNVTTVLSGLSQGTHYSDVKRFNAATQVWESFAGSQFTQFEPGVGYNIIGLTTASFDYGETETTTTFIYDSTGARVKKTAGGETAIYLGKDYEVDNVTIKHIFLGDRRITTKKSSGEISYIHDDHISSSNVVTDASGNQSAMYEYDPYGATVTHTGAVDLKHQFTGQEKDDSTGLHYYNARYYDSQLGRFITADPTIQRPTDPQDFNRYAYARNNPIKFNDPTGFGWFSKLIGAIVGAIVGVVTTIATGCGSCGWAAGVAAYRGVDTLLSGGTLKETIIASANGASEGYRISTGQKSGWSLLGDPKTDELSNETKKDMKLLFASFGMDPKSTNVTVDIIDNSLGKQRSYSQINSDRDAGNNPDRNQDKIKNPASSFVQLGYSIASLASIENLASGAAEEFSGLKRGGRNGKGDAFRHQYFSGKLTEDFGSGGAGILTTAHEVLHINSQSEFVMDMRNNRVGRQTGSQNIPNLYQAVSNNIESGRYSIYVDGRTSRAY